MPSADRVTLSRLCEMLSSSSSDDIQTFKVAAGLEISGTVIYALGFFILFEAFFSYMKEHYYKKCQEKKNNNSNMETEVNNNEEGIQLNPLHKGRKKNRARRKLW